MERRRGLVTAVATVLLGLVPVPLLARPASAAVPVSCRSSAHPSLAARMDRDIDRALRGRVSAVAIGVDDPGQRLQCWPTSLTVHVKNGWLPLYPHGWRINSIGAFTGRGGGYSIVVLTQDNPTMTYGIDTIEAVAKVVNRDLNPKARSRVPSSPSSTSWCTPDETIPAAADTP